METERRLICLDDLIKIMRAEDKRYPNVPWSTTAVARLCEPMVLDAVEVVRCKDCWKSADGLCSYKLKNVPGKDFCGDGERLVE